MDFDTIIIYILMKLKNKRKSLIILFKIEIWKFVSVNSLWLKLSKVVHKLNWVGSSFDTEFRRMPVLSMFQKSLFIRAAN